MTVKNNFELLWFMKASFSKDRKSKPKNVDKKASISLKLLPVWGAKWLVFSDKITKNQHIHTNSSLTFSQHGRAQIVCNAPGCYLTTQSFISKFVLSKRKGLFPHPRHVVFQKRSPWTVPSSCISNLLITHANWKIGDTHHH